MGGKKIEHLIFIKIKLKKSHETWLLVYIFIIFTFLIEYNWINGKSFDKSFYH